MHDDYELAGPVAELEAATWRRRAAAVLIDGLLFIGALVVPVVLVLVAVISAWDEATDDFTFTGGETGLLTVGILTGIGVFVWAGWLFGYRQGVTGTTPGKRRLRIRLVSAETGEAPGGAKGVGRWLVPILIGGIQGIGNAIQLIDYLWPVWDSKNQRLIDKVFRTRVLVGLPIAEASDGPELPASPIS